MSRYGRFVDARVIQQRMAAKDARINRAMKGPPMNPSLFSEPVRVTFTDAEREVLDRPIVGDGGHQRLLRMLASRMDGRTLMVTDDELLKTCRYAYAYGSGGYQQEFKTIICAARRAGWREVTPE